MGLKHNILFGTILFALFLSPAIYAAGPSAVNLGSSGNFAILAKTGISATGATSVAGDMGVSPAAATYMTGFGLIADSSNQFSTSSLLNGKAFAANYAPPTPAKMTTAVSDMQTAYTDAAGRTNPTATELGAGNIGGMTLAPGLYKWGTGVTIPTDTTLSGGANDVWIFQIGQTLNVGNGAAVILSGGAQPQNIFWQVAGQATLGTTSSVQGIILSQTAIVLKTGARLNGRALAQTAVTLDASTVTAPVGTTLAPTPTQIPPQAGTAQTPTPTPTPQQATTPPAPAPAPQQTTQPSNTISSSNPDIIQTAYVPLSGLSQAQIAQNLALGLPVGTATSNAQATAPTPQPAPTPAPQPATAQPTPAPRQTQPAQTQAGSATQAAPKPVTTQAPTAAQAETPTPAAANSGIFPEIGSAVQSFFSWLGSLAGGFGK